MKNNNLIATKIFFNLKKMFLTVQDFFKSHKIKKYIVCTDNNIAKFFLWREITKRLGDSSEEMY